MALICMGVQKSIARPLYVSSMDGYETSIVWHAWAGSMAFICAWDVWV